MFGGVYGVKRLQPGLSCGRGGVGSYRHEVEALLHDSSTLAAIRVRACSTLVTGDVLGVHFGGRYAVANHAVPASELACDGRVIDAGLAFAGEPTRRRTPWDERWAALAPCPPRPPADPQPEPHPMAAPESPTIRITVPIEPSISIGTAQTGGAAVQVVSGAAEPRAADSRQAGPSTERAVEVARDTDCANRTGYDPTFLETEVAPPTASDPSVLCVPQGGGTLLHYHHFSIAMHRRQRLPLFTASNVTAAAAPKRPENRPDADYTRRGLGDLGESDRERWFGDPQIRVDEQLPDRFFEQDRGSFDKGHVVRREDVAWGQTYAEMRAANGDTFHVTNCTPQISTFNQASRGEDNWGDLETLIQAQAKTERLAVFAGPVMAEGDPIFTGLDTKGPVAVPIPVRSGK